MTTNQLRQQAQIRLEQLDPDLLPVVDDFLAYLEQRGVSKATDELARIAGIKKAFTKARGEVAAGQVVAAKDLKRKY